MTKFVGYFILVTSLYAATVAAQEPEQKLTMPGPEVQNFMLGTWSIKVRYPPTPQTPKGDAGEGTEIWRPGPGGRSVIEEYREKNSKGEVEGLGVAWCIERRIELVHIQPGRPMQNGQVESFHGKLRDECLRVNWFGNLFEARRKIAAWRTEYNQERPHSSLGYRTPEEFARESGGEKGCGKDGGFAILENAPRFPLSHSHGGDGLSTSEAVSNPDVVV